MIEPPMTDYKLRYGEPQFGYFAINILLEMKYLTGAMNIAQRFSTLGAVYYLAIIIG